MSIRSLLTRRKRTIFGVAGFGFLILAGPILYYWYKGPDPDTFVHLLSVVIFLLPLYVVLALCAYFLIRCPKCKGALSNLVMKTGHPFAVSGKLHHCPYCGIGFDED